MAKSPDNINVRCVLLTEFTDTPSQLVNSENQNAFDLYCAKGCESLILRANLGTWVERPKDKVLKLHICLYFLAFFLSFFLFFSFLFCSFLLFSFISFLLLLLI